MRIDAIELHRLRMPLVRPFETSFGRQETREVLLVRVRSAAADGWGECVALSAPVYSSEYVDGCQDVLRRYLAPAVLAAEHGDVEQFGALTGFVVGHRMAKAALEAALLDAELTADGRSFGEYLGAVRTEVDCGVSVGIAGSLAALLDEVTEYRAQGYRRIKLKIKPGWDLEPVAAVRELLGPDFPLQVDANTAYRRADIDHLVALDRFTLLLVEQPFAEEDIASHAALAAVLNTPVCLDESILDAATAVDAIERRATRVINIKAGRVGGYREAVRVHDACRSRGIPVWCGGMLETGIGRAANVALAALPGFTLPGDTSASGRYYREDITDPFVLQDGRLAVPTGPGIGVTVRDDLIRELASQAPIVLRRE